eukprot:270592-Rhodomonas_salina.1
MQSALRGYGPTRFVLWYWGSGTGANVLATWPVNDLVCGCVCVCICGCVERREREGSGLESRKRERRWGQGSREGAEVG